MLFIKLLVLEAGLVMILRVDHIHVGSTLHKEVEDVFVLEHGVVELMSRVFVSFQEQSQRGMTFVINLVGVVAISLGKEHLHKL